MPEAGKRRALKGAAVAAALSLAVHGAVTALLPGVAPHEPATLEAATLELDVSPEARPAPDVVVGHAGAAAARAPSAVPVTHQAGLRVRRGASVVVLPPAEPATVVDPDVGVPPAACDTATRPLAIDPRSAALAGLSEEAGANTVDEAIGRDLSASLGRTANARPWSTRRAAPELRRTRDGGYEYTSSRFNAHIDSDGAVHFSDHDAVTLQGPGDGTSTILGGHFDLTEELMRANGQDPLAPERAWFMAETEELRTRLDARARHAEGETSLQLLAQRLAAITANHALSPAQQRARVFDTWDDCATDALGDRARETIVDFAREHFPAGSTLAYTQAELAAMNGRRATSLRFDPYRS